MHAPLRRLLASSALCAVTLLAGTTAAGAGHGHILRVSRLSDPAIIDVTVTMVSFDRASSAITVTGSVTCLPGFEVLTVDLTAVQRRGRATAAGNGFLQSPSCGDTFSGVITPTEKSFRPGRATIEVDVLACGLRCGEEILRVEAVLVP
jgi:hypothetical protein